MVIWLHINHVIALKIYIYLKSFEKFWFYLRAIDSQGMGVFEKLRAE